MVSDWEDERQCEENKDPDRYQVIPSDLIDGLREALETKLSRRQVVAVVRIACGVSRLARKLEADELAKRCDDLLGVLGKDLELKRLHGKR